MSQIITKGQRAAAILEAGDSLFGERGFDGVSVADVAARAGVNKALVFYYYGSKDALFERVLEGYYEAHQEALEQAFSQQGPVAQRFHAVIDAYLDFIDGHRHYPRLVQREVAADGPHLALIRRSLAPLLAWTQAVLREVAPAEGPLAARQFFVTFSGVVINYFTYAQALAPIWGGDPLSPEGIADRRAHVHWLVDRVLDGLEVERERS